MQNTYPTVKAIWVKQVEAGEVIFNIGVAEHRVSEAVFKLNKGPHTLFDTVALCRKSVNNLNMTMVNDTKFKDGAKVTN